MLCSSADAHSFNKLLSVDRQGVGIEEAGLKERFLELLDKDREFRYAVAGKLGLSEILERLERHEKIMLKLWREVRTLRKDQEKLWKNQERLWEEVRALRENQEKLWEGQNKLWEEVRALREEQRKLWENQERLWRGLEGLRVGMETGFRSLAVAVGRTFDDYTAAFVEVILEELGYPREKIKVEKRRKIIYEEGREVEINVFNEDPLVIGEVTTFLGSAEQATREVEKLVKRVELAQKVFGRKVEYAFLAVANASKEALERLKEEAEKSGVKLIVGRVIEEQTPASSG